MPLGSIVGGLIGQGGASSASGILGQGIQASQQQQQANETAFGPYKVSGINAQSLLDQLYGFGALTPNSGSGPGGWNVTGDPTGSIKANAFTQFTTSPGYDFRQAEGAKALDRSAAAKGGLFSGAQAKALTDYGQNTASAEYNNWLAGLNSMAGNGLSATSSEAGVNSSLQNGQNALYTGQANATQAGANALASGIQNGMKNVASIASFNPYGAFGNI